MKRTIRVYDYDCCKDRGFPEGLTDFIQWMLDRLAEIPEEFQDSARIELSATTCYDCGELEFRITYERPETPEEEQARLREKEARDAYERKNAKAQMDDIRRRYPDL